MAVLEAWNDALNRAAAWIRKTGKRFPDLCFWLGFAIELAVTVIEKSSLTNPYEGQLFRLTFLLFLIRLLSERFTFRERCWLLFFLVLGGISYIFSGRNEILRFTVFAAACVRLDQKKAMQVCLYVTTAGCLLLNVLSLSGVLGEVWQTAVYGDTEETRLVLGLGHPNSLHCMASMMLVLFLYLYHGKLKKWHYAVLLAASIGLYALTGSSMGLLLAAAALFLDFLTVYAGNLAGRNGFYIAGEILFALGIAFSVFAGVVSVWKCPWLHWIDDHFLTGRIVSLWQTTFNDGTLSTWRWFSDRNSTQFFDLGWVRLIYWYGVIPAAVIFVCLFKWMRILRRRRDAAAFVMLFVLLMYTVFEAHLVSEYLGRNFLLLLGAMYVPAAAGESETV